MGGDAAQKMRYADYMALLLASVALWIYNLEKEKTPILESNLNVDEELVDMPRRSQLSMLTASVCADGPGAAKGLIASSFEADNGGRQVSVMRIGSTIKVNGRKSSDNCTVQNQL